MTPATYATGWSPEVDYRQRQFGHTPPFSSGS